MTADPSGELVSFNVLNRNVHYWASFTIAVPLLVMICSGLLLQAKKQWNWVQPAEQRGTGTAPAIDFDGILTSLRTVPDMGVTSWDDVNRLDVRPGRGMVKVLAQQRVRGSGRSWHRRSPADGLSPVGPDRIDPRRIILRRRLDQTRTVPPNRYYGPAVVVGRHVDVVGAIHRQAASLSRGRWASCRIARGRGKRAVDDGRIIMPL